MDKTKISVKRRALSKSIVRRQTSQISKVNLGIDTYNPTAALLDEDRIGRAIWECLKEGDAEGVIEVIQIHLEAVNKTQLARKATLSKTTLYHALRSKNPTIKTLAKLVQGCF